MQVGIDSAEVPLLIRRRTRLDRCLILVKDCRTHQKV
jgi:hypothetical protein